MSSTSGLPERLQKHLDRVSKKHAGYKYLIVEAGIVLFLAATQKEQEKAISDVDLFYK